MRNERNKQSSIIKIMNYEERLEQERRANDSTSSIRVPRARSKKKLVYQSERIARKITTIQVTGNPLAAPAMVCTMAVAWNRSLARDK
jgi:hypothetical protein